TIVGDPAQAAWSDPAEAAKAMSAAVGSRRRSEFTLTTNYRNSAEIFELAARVIRRAEPGIDLPTAVRKAGVAPELTTVDAGELAAAVRDAAATLLTEVAGTVGVIGPDVRRDEIAGWISGLDGDRLQAVGSLDAKGMEYDGVVVVE